MPVLAPTKPNLFVRGQGRVALFCEANRITIPKFNEVPVIRWHFGSTCAYYRPQAIWICLEKCAYPASETYSRNWNWPGSTTDREPYGVLCHELGHHCDWLKSKRKGSYFGDYGEHVMRASGEPPITSYATDPAEWFAEMFRVFVTNHALIRCLRPRTHALLIQDWMPVSKEDWRAELGKNVPERIVKALVNKGAC